MSLCSCSLCSILLAQELDIKVMSQRLVLLGAGLWLDSSVSRASQASSSACKKSLSCTDLALLSHPSTHSFSLHHVYTFFCPLYSSFFCSSVFGGSGGPSLLSIYLGCIQKSASHSEHRGEEERRGEGRDRKLWLCASTVIFFITEPALTQIMECTGSLSERQQEESGPLPTLGYANPSTAVWV